MKKFMLILIGILFFLPGCTYAIRYDGEYTGRVIDADTGAPIEGVVVLGYWEKEYPTVAGPKHEFYDAEETVTDKNGVFTISGKGLRMLSNLEPMRIRIFKAGYDNEGGTWKSFKEDTYYKDRIKWEGAKPIIQLKKLTMEERKKRGDPDYPPFETPKEKMKLMMKEINKDRIERGLGTVEFGR